MNIALILAGGSGTRTGNAVPKQFITVHEIPVIVYTMMNIQKIDAIDEIVVSVAEGWESFVKMYGKQHGVNKLTDVIAAGNTRHQTISKAVEYLSRKYSCDSKIVIVDANRPLIPERVVTQSIERLQCNECTVALLPCYDTMYISNDAVIVDQQIDRQTLYGGQTPECATLSDLVNVYEWAKDNGVEDATSALFLKCDKKIRVVEGSSKSFKITTQDDLELFKAMINAGRKDREE